jgi:cysteine desulfuration protein SufE
MQSIEEKENDLIEEFEWIEDSLDRYEHIISIGKALPALDEKYHKDEFIVKGCQSTVWLRAYKEDDRIFFEADSNTIITKGLVAILVRVMSGEKASTIINHNLEIIDKLDLRSHLTSQRSNGFSAMIEKMKWYASIL